jgi:starvation-inducible DNA-binding protein
MKNNNSMTIEDRAEHGIELSREGVAEISRVLRELLADVFALYLKTKNFHWHMSGRHFRDYHLLLDEQGDQLFAMTDEIAERGRKIGGTTLRSISDISAHQRLSDNNQEVISPDDMLGELLSDSRRLTEFLRVTHEICGRHNDVATTSMIEVWIDQTERRTWFLAEVVGRT